MPPPEPFVSSVLDAYEHLYDIAYLCGSPLIEALIENDAVEDIDRARQLHNLLLNLIDELDPGPRAPITSREWRRHRLLLLRYIDGAMPQAVADQLSISRRHFYREHKDAVDAIAAILWQRRVQTAPAPPERPSDRERVELMRQEVARLQAASPHPQQLSDVIQGVISLTEGLAHEKGIRLEAHLPAHPPVMGGNAAILRQILLGQLSLLIATAEGGAVRFTVEEAGARAWLALHRTGAARPPADPETVVQQLDTIREMAALNNLELTIQRETDAIAGFRLELPGRTRRVILVVEDNEDVVQLFQNYLTKNDFRMVNARNGSEALEKAKSLQPYAITLDVMIPDPDGWSVLQTLHNQLETRHIPVVICTVLSARDLALSLGAAGFLEKPVTEQGLLAVLHRLEAPGRV